MPRRTTTCVFDTNLNMFRVTKAKGKAISNGGFGVSWAVKVKTQTTNNLNKDDSLSPDPDPDPDQYITSDYLFIEEVLFLHERGMIDVFVPAADNKDDPEKYLAHKASSSISAGAGAGADTSSESESGSIKPIYTQDLYDMMLHDLNVPLSVYLVYAHLRSQTFIVIRHTIHRSGLIKKLEDKCKDKGKGPAVIVEVAKESENENENASNEKEMNNDAVKQDVDLKNKDGHGYDNGKWKKKRRTSAPLASLKKDLRKDAFEAPIPAILRDQNFSLNPCDGDFDGDDNDDNDDDDDAKESTVDTSDKDFKTWSSCIAFDCYNPNGSFRKSNPGQPDFYVAITSFAEPSPTISTFNKIIKSCGDTSFRVASVSDGGTVVMFNMTDVGVPAIS